mgnify:CR=1 FL=1
MLVASVHQAIAELLPARLGFYETWLTEEGLREGTVGLAPFYAALSFLRREGDAYRPVMARAGDYAAQWTVDSMGETRRRLIGALPRFLRRRVLLSVWCDLVRTSHEETRATWRILRGTARLDIRASVFCAVRERAATPLCTCYASAVERILSMFGIEDSAAIVACRATGGETCVLEMPPAQPSASGEGA